MKYRIHLLFAAIILGMCTQGIFAQETGKVRGKVVDAKDSVPLEGAIVRIERTGFGAQTDASGEFVILNVPVGTYNFTASYIGYDFVHKNDMEVKKDSVFYLNFEMKLYSGPYIEIFFDPCWQPTLDCSGTIFEKERIKNTGIR